MACGVISISRSEIETYSANMHFIPATDPVKSDINRIREGDIIEISGSLVNAESNAEGWEWKSSQTYTDTGDNMTAP